MIMTFVYQLVLSLHSQLKDSYGDGWNGGYFTVTSCPSVIEDGVSQTSGQPAGTGADYPFTVTACSEIVPGCTNENALNFDSDATHDDGSVSMLCSFNVRSRRWFCC